MVGVGVLGYEEAIGKRVRFPAPLSPRIHWETQPRGAFVSGSTPPLMRRVVGVEVLLEVRRAEAPTKRQGGGSGDTVIREASTRMHHGQGWRGGVVV